MRESGGGKTDDRLHRAFGWPLPVSGPVWMGCRDMVSKHKKGAPQAATCSAQHKE